VVSTEGLFRSAALDQGDNFTFRFAKPGTYRSICSIHPNMRAVVVVK
jgi:plastocyanin